MGPAGDFHSDTSFYFFKQNVTFLNKARNQTLGLLCFGDLVILIDERTSNYTSVSQEHRMLFNICRAGTCCFSGSCVSVLRPGQAEAAARSPPASFLQGLARGQFPSGAPPPPPPTVRNTTNPNWLITSLDGLGLEKRDSVSGPPNVTHTLNMLASFNQLPDRTRAF